MTPVALRSPWPTAPAWALFSREQRGVREGDGVVTAFRDGQVTLRSNRRQDGFTNAVEEIGYQGVRAGDLVIHSMDGFAGAIGISESDGKASPVVHCYTPSAGADARYYAYLLRDLAVRGYVSSLSKGIRERSTAFDAETFRSLVLPVPPQPRQRVIADYLDSETARIDALILKKMRMKELLEEREAAERDVIVLSVGAGSTCSLRWLLREAISDGPHETPDFIEDGVPFLSVDNIVDSQVVFDGCRMISEADHVRYCRKLRPGLGDVLITKAASVGKVALVEDGRDFNIWSPIAVLRTDHSVLLPEFLWQYLRTRMAQRELSLGSTSNTQQNISMRDLGSLRVPVVSIQDQRKACEQLSKEVRGLLNTIEDSVAVLRERRQALITAAVTGQIEVPQVAA